MKGTILSQAACFSLASDRSPVSAIYRMQRIQDVSTKAKLNGSVGIQPFRPSTTATLSARVPALSVHRSSSLSPFFVSLSKPLSLLVYVSASRIEMNKYRVPHFIKLYMALHPRANVFEYPVYKTGTFRGHYGRHNTRHYANL